MSNERARAAGSAALGNFTADAPEGDRFNCAESVLKAVSEAEGIGSGAVPGVASAFGGGMAHQGNVCGAVTGALMAIGLARGRKAKSDPRAPSNEPAAELLRRFQSEFGAVNCRDLTGCDLNTPEGQESFKAVQAAGACRKYVDMAARATVELLDGKN
jgi:C_GCAxxG_C_C family probable redox protein